MSLIRRHAIQVNLEMDISRILREAIEIRAFLDRYELVVFGRDRLAGELLEAGHLLVESAERLRPTIDCVAETINEYPHEAA